MAVGQSLSIDNTLNLVLEANYQAAINGILASTIVITPKLYITNNLYVFKNNDLEKHMI